VTICEKCGAECIQAELVWKQTARQTMSSPAEHDNVGCVHCLPEGYDEAYEQAAAKYTGENGEKDWR
jgi:hypothetical protein